jgi:AcrR family transcriptional regulator
MGIAERKEREKSEMRSLILDAAMKLFLELGYEHVTLRKIAEAIEYSPGTVYLYFKDKNEILYDLQKRAFSLFFESQNSILEKFLDPEQRLYKLGEAYIDFALQNPSHYELMFILTAPMACLAEGAEWEEGGKAFEILLRTVTECMQKGLIPEGDPMAASLLFWSSMHGLVTLSIRGRLVGIPVEQHRVLFQNTINYLQKTIKG